MEQPLLFSLQVVIEASQKATGVVSENRSICNRAAENIANLSRVGQISKSTVLDGKILK